MKQDQHHVSHPSTMQSGCWVRLYLEYSDYSANCYRCQMKGYHGRDTGDGRADAEGHVEDLPLADAHEAGRVAVQAGGPDAFGVSTSTGSES